MAWRLSEYLIKGELDNSTPGKVVGWLQLAGKERITLDLKGNFPKAIQGKKISLGNGISPLYAQLASLRNISDEKAKQIVETKGKKYLKNFSEKHVGELVEITVPQPLGVWTKERITAVVKSMEKSGFFNQESGLFSRDFIEARRKVLEKKVENKESYYPRNAYIEWDSESNGQVILEVFPENVAVGSVSL